MGVSFKISKIGKKFKPRPKISDSVEPTDNSLETSPNNPLKNQLIGKDKDAVGQAGSSITSGTLNNCPEDEISFTLSLFPDGYSIGKPSQNDNGLHTTFQDGSKLLHPYDRTSEGLFSAIESGRLPGGILDDVPCKYVDGSLICEVRDYRKCISGSGPSIPPVNGSAMIAKVRLKMSLENVVKDIPLMADDSWTYGDLMEVESRILKALQPKLCLDPTPRLDRLCENPAPPKLNLGLVGKRKRRLRDMPEVTVTSNNRPHGKKISIDRAPESSSFGIRELGSSSGGDMVTHHVQDSVAAQVIGSNNMSGPPGDLRNMSNSAQGHINVPGMARMGQDIPVSYGENMNSTAPGKMETQEGLYSTSTNKRTRLDAVQQQQIGSYVDGLPDVQWRNQLVQQQQQQQQNARGIQYSNAAMQHKYPHLVNEDGIKMEKPDVNLVKSEMQNSFMRAAFQQPNWTNLTQQPDNNPRREDQFSKRKSIQSPRLSSGAVAQSPFPAKSGEVSCGSMGAHYGAVSSAPPFGQLQRDKTTVTSIPAVDRATSLTSSANDTMQPQHQAQLTANKRRSNSFSKNPVVMSGVGSPASVNTVGGPMNASSPSISTPQLTEQSIIERFSKLESVARRIALNCRKNKVEEYPRKPRTFSPQELLLRLSSTTNNEYLKDEDCTRPLSQSLVGGSINICKLRVLTLRPERTVQGNVIPVSPGVRTRLILSEKPSDGTVAMHYGDLSDEDYLNAEDYLPTLPNTHWADLLAEQFCSLMIREGCMVENHVQPRPPRPNVPSNSQANTCGGMPNNGTGEMQQYSESSGQQTHETKPTISNNAAAMNSSSNIMPSSGMLSSATSQASQGLVSGVSIPPQPQPQQMDPTQQLPLQNQPSLMPHQQQQFSRTPLMLPTNSMSQLNSLGQSSSIPLGSHIGSKHNPLQLMQQQQQQQQQQPMQRRMMMGLGPAMGMGGIGNNMVGLGGLGNVMGIGGARAMGGAGGITAPMGAMSGGIGANVGQTPISISQHIRGGTLSQQQAAAQAAMVKMRLLQSRGLMQGNQAGVSGITGGPRQMPVSGGLTMLGQQTLSRGNLSPMQRTALSQMGQMSMSKLMPGMNVPMNQQQMQLQQLQLQQQQQQQQQMQQQQQQQLHMQQQEASSPLQSVVSHQQVGSPSMGIPQSMNQQVAQQQQQASPQQMGQRTPMSPPLSSGPVHPMSAGNPEACPASPALSSQTLGSVGSITNSPMDLQGVNKSNSVTNT